MISVEGLTKRFNDQYAVRNVTFSLERGQILSLIGKSGSGKTSLLKCLNHLLRPDSGKIIIDGIDISTVPPENFRRKMGYVVQDYGLFPHYNIYNNIALPLQLAKFSKQRIEIRVRELMSMMEMDFNKYAKVFPENLSGGQKQRVGLARALASNPSVLLMDEPFSALDPVSKQNIKEFFKNLPQLKDTSVIMVTHDIVEAFELSDLVGVMSDGTMLQCSTPDLLLSYPVSDIVENFLQPHLFDIKLQLISLDELWSHIQSVESGSLNLEVLGTDITIKTLMNKLSSGNTVSVKNINGLYKEINLPILLQSVIAYTTRKLW